MPDILDAAAWAFRGKLGQWLGHSLLGVVLSVPLGFPLVRLVRRVCGCGAVFDVEPNRADIDNCSCGGGRVLRSVAIACASMSVVTGTQPGGLFVVVNPM